MKKALLLSVRAAYVVFALFLCRRSRFDVIKLTSYGCLTMGSLILAVSDGSGYGTKYRKVNSSRLP